MQRERNTRGTAEDDRLREETKDLIRETGAARAEEGGSGGGSASSRGSGATRGISPADVARRAELSRHLPPSEFPADRRRLLAHLRSRKAPDSVVEAISGLPEGQECRTIGEVVRAIGLRT